MSIAPGWFEGRVPRAAAFESEAVPASDVGALLAAHRGPGWVCTTDAVGRVSGSGDDLPPGKPLCAEIALGGARSLHVRQHGTGFRAWILEDKLGEGPYLALDEKFLSTERPARLCYRVYFRQEPDPSADAIGVWRPFAFRFLGWEDG